LTEHLKDEGKWGEMQDAIIDAMTRLDRAFGPRIRALKL
jgi:hypothetical protein